MQWTIDPSHSHIQFSIRHMGISTVRGTFGQLSGTIEEDGGEVKGADLEVDVASINTNVGARDEHLRGADFFDTATHPKASFHLTRAEQKGEEITLTGDMVIRGVSKPITFKGEVAGPVKDPWGNQKVSASVQAEIARSDWGLVYNATLETGGLLLSDKVKLLIDVEASPTPVAAAA